MILEGRPAKAEPSKALGATSGCIYFFFRESKPQFDFLPIHRLPIRPGTTRYRPQSRHLLMFSNVNNANNPSNPLELSVRSDTLPLRPGINVIPCEVYDIQYRDTTLYRDICFFSTSKSIYQVYNYLRIISPNRRLSSRRVPESSDSGAYISTT